MINPLPSQGDIVDVTLKGVQVTHVEPAVPGFSAVVYVSVPKTDKVGGGGNTIFLHANSPHVTATVAERAAPTNWPPRAGDLWRDGDRDLWFATTAHVYQHGPDGDFPATPVVELVHAGGNRSRKPDEVNRDYGPMELVRREQADGQERESTVEAPGAGWSPQVGDVWMDASGDRWDTIATNQGVRLRLEGTAGSDMPWRVLRDYGPLKLVKR